MLQFISAIEYFRFQLSYVCSEFKFSGCDLRKIYRNMLLKVKNKTKKM